MILFAWDGWRWLGYSHGWVDRDPRSGEKIVVVETVFIRDRYRGRKTLLAFQQFLAKVDSYCRRRGIKRFVTRIAKSRPEVLRAGRRWGYYVPYSDDGEFTWCYRNIPDAASSASFSASRRSSSGTSAIPTS